MTEPRAVPTVLAKIAAQVAVRVEEMRCARPLEALRAQARAARAPHDFAAAFNGAGVKIIAEVKLASPSRGAIAAGVDPLAVAGEYLRAGAAALSVLTERDHFSGSPESLRAIRQAHPEARLLMKDFVIDEYQIYQARELGADAVLLIVALLDQARLARFHALATELGLAALVEVHDRDELDRALELRPRLVGVNNRDLKTLAIDPETSFHVIGSEGGAFKSACTWIAESGISRGSEIRPLVAAGFHGFLVGSSLMETGEPGAALGRLLADCQAQEGTKE